GGQQAGSGSGGRCEEPLAVLRRDGGAPRRLSHGLSGRRLCGALSPVGGEGSGGRGGAHARQDGFGRRGRPLPVQIDGLQGRIRGGASLCRRVVRQAGEARTRRRASALFRASSPPRSSPAATRSPASRKR